MRQFFLVVICLFFSFASYAQGSNERQVAEHYDLLIGRYDSERYSWLDAYNRHLREGHQYYTTDAEFNDRARELRAEIDRCSREIARLNNEKNARLQEARNRDRQQAEQYKAAQRKQQQQQQNAQRKRQIQAQQQRELELEARREQARREAEERRKAEELARQIKYEKDYNDEIRRTSSYYAGKRDQVNWMASRDALNQMYSSFERSRLEMSIDDVRPQVSGAQVTQASGVGRLKKRVSERSTVGPVFEDGFFNDRVFRSLNEDVFLNSPDLVWLKANKETVQEYWEKIDKSNEPSADYPLAYTEWLYEQFESLSGYDIKDILHKTSRSENERQALLDFNMFATQLLNDKEKELDSVLKEIDSMPEKKVADMAILAAIPYGTNDEFLRYTDYKPIDSSNAPKEVKDIAKMIELCNDDTYGFHAQLFYNDITNEYTISFEGSSTSPFPGISDFIDHEKSKFGLSDGNHSEWYKDWVAANAVQGLGGVPDQFKLVTSIAEMVNKAPGVDIKLTGHSLGGGLASFCGLLTGRETATFNAEGINTKISGGAIGKNITAYHDKYDILTIGQKITPAANAIGKEVVVDVEFENKEGLAEKATGHMIAPMARHFINIPNEANLRWNKISHIKDKYSEAFFELSMSSLAAQ